MTPTDAIQAGGVLAFAGLVLYILRELRPVLKDVASQLFEMRITFSALLERERIRDDRRKRDSTPPHLRRPIPSYGPAEVQPLRAVPGGEFDHDETTDIVKLIEKQREAATNPRGTRAPRPGTHHDKER